VWRAARRAHAPRRPRGRGLGRGATKPATPERTPHPPRSQPGCSHTSASSCSAHTRPPVIAPDGAFFHHAMLRPVTDRERPPPERTQPPRCFPGCSHTPLHPPTHENVQSPLGPPHTRGPFFTQC